MGSLMMSLNPSNETFNQPVLLVELHVPAFHVFWFDIVSCKKPVCSQGVRLELSSKKSLILSRH